jgi:ABC-type branched-subunit amino acid transport system permease subunit
MRGGVLHHASGVHPHKPLVVRGGLARTFGSLAGFLAVTFLCGGLYILEDAFANPLDAGAAALVSAAFIITLAAMLLFYLIKPRKRIPNDEPRPRR